MGVSFEEFIIQCCKAEERTLRKWIRKVIPRYDFSITEDDYVSERAKENPAFNEVHNLLAIRGDSPRVCLVAHTDVCRDHEKGVKPIYYGNKEDKTPDGMRRVQPVIKRVEAEEEDYKVQKRIIQDKTCDTQVGGDDRLGVAINLWVALNTGFDMALLFTTDEEIGLRSARAVDFPELKKFDLCLQVDRGNHSHELVNKIGSTSLCDYDTSVRLLEIAYDMGQPRKTVVGAGTDVVAMKERKVIKNAVNMTCGYHCSYGSGSQEYIDIEEARKTAFYIGEIIKNYSLEE